MVGEWNSEFIRNAPLYDDSFNMHMVTIMEDSEALSEYTEYLSDMVKGGVRQKFTSINASSIAKKVLRFLGFSSTEQMFEMFYIPESYIMDITAEAIKQELLELKAQLAIEAAIPKKDEITGARSKDMMVAIQPILTKSNSASVGQESQTKSGGKGNIQSSNDETLSLLSASREDITRENASEIKLRELMLKADDYVPKEGNPVEKEKKKKKGKEKKTGDKSEGEDSKNKEAQKKKNKKEKSSSKKGSKLSGSLIRTVSIPLPKPNEENRQTILRKRGEQRLSVMYAEDEAPEYGPQLYVILQGFYNPDLLDALNAIGVKLDGIVLLTRNKVTKRNFSVIDIEENFSGAFQPQNVSPDYLKKVEEKLNESGNGHGPEISMFWMNLAKKLNKASPDSFIHDIALLNCEMPQLPLMNNGEIAPDKLGTYVVNTLQAVAQRMFEMAIFQNWHKEYQDTTEAKNIEATSKLKQAAVYQNFMNRIPSECVTLPLIMESLLAQVEEGVEASLTSTGNDFTSTSFDSSVKSSLADAEQINENMKQEVEEAEDEDKSENMSSENADRLKTKQKTKSKKSVSKKEKDKSDKKSNDEFPEKNKKEKPAKTKSENVGKNERRKSRKSGKKLNSKVLRGSVINDNEDYQEIGEWKPPIQLSATNFYADQSFSQEFARLQDSKGPSCGYRPLQSRAFITEHDLEKCPAPDPCKAPIYIKSNDFASIRNCHLRDSLAELVASNQVSGDYSSLRNFLWDGAPEFDKELYMKLHANLIHFMHFLPPDILDLKEMFFIIHLLMSSGIELQLQKEARIAALRDIEENCTESSTYCCDDQAKKFRSLLSIYEKPKLSDEEVNMSTDYMALGDELYKARMFLAPPNDKINVARSKTLSKGDAEIAEATEYINARGLSATVSTGSLNMNKVSRSESGTMSVGLADVSKVVVLDMISNKPSVAGIRESTGDDVKFLLHPSELEFDTENTEHKRNLSQSRHSSRHGSKKSESRKEYVNDENFLKKEESNKHNLLNEEQQQQQPRHETLDKIEGAVIATGNIIYTSAQLATVTKYGYDYEEIFGEYASPRSINLDASPFTPPNTAVSRETVDKNVALGKSSDSKSFTTTQSRHQSFYDVKCQDRYFQNAKDLTILQALITCPALLALSDSGALDISKWVETYMLCKGLSRASGEGIVVGQLKDWNYVEEMVPVQVIQALQEASQSYLSMERIYCPFYDTILFVFNDPTPYSLCAESTYITKLNTVAGLQHFLEYNLNDREVMQFVIDTEKSKRMSTAKTLSVTTLMRLIPEDQWILIPSIKYVLQQREKQRRTMMDLESDEYEGEDNEETYYAATEGTNRKKIIPRKKIRQKIVIDLGDGELNESTSAHSRSSKPNQDDLMGSDKEKDDNDKKRKKSKKKTSNGSVKSDRKSSKKRHSDGQESVKSKDAAETSLPENADKKQDKIRSKVKEDVDTPIPLSTTAEGSNEEVDTTTHYTCSSKEATGKQSTSTDDLFTSQLREKRFKAYDLGKRHLITTSDDYHLFPLDGTTISYNVSTIEPDFRMMQLKVSKNKHDIIFYPYYIPHDADMAEDSFVLIPHFHATLANGTIFAFKDKRTQEDSRYVKFTFSSRSVNKGKSSSRIAACPELSVFNLNNVVFIDDYYLAMMESKKRALRSPELDGEDAPYYNSKSNKTSSTIPESYTAETNRVSVSPEVANFNANSKLTITSTKEENRSEGVGKKQNKSKRKRDKKNSISVVSSARSEDIVKKNNKSKKKGKGNNRDDEEKRINSQQPKALDEIDGGIADENDEEENEMEETNVNSISETQPAGEWKYPSSDETDVDDKLIHTPSKENITFNWDDAEQLIKPLSHIYKITLPSGLYIEVSDMEGPPYTREVKQKYIPEDSTRLLTEKSRYYTMNGTVVRFLTYGTIQTLTARGTTTNIRELSARVKVEDNVRNPMDRFKHASLIKVFRGDTILPTGDFWHITKGKRVKHDPLFLFTSGTMSNGEIFRRRQDGTVYIHRNDGCCIIQYPDGTRFTTRMIIQDEQVPEFEDWVFVGLKYMIEHPDYVPVIINTLSGNINIRLPQGEWTRILADGSIRIHVSENYKIDVDSHRALLSSPGFKHANPHIPNLTAVKLYHSKEVLSSTENATDQTTTTTTEPTPKQNAEKVSKKREWTGEDGDEDFYYNSIRSSVSKRQSFAGEATKDLMDKNLRPPLKSKSKKSSVKDQDSLDATSGGETPENEADSDKKEIDIENFVRFCDMWTLVKSTDSYDNRLAMDIFGNMIVDKSENCETQAKKSADCVITSQCDNLSNRHLSGIVSAASSKELATQTQRLKSLTKSHSEYCSSKPKTRIFVVKRDLSGYEFLKQAVVDRMIKKARSNPAAIVLTDPLPLQTARKFITIMEPIKDCENPNGVWKSLYREPVFRPQNFCRKGLIIPRPEELRWFANVLATAHMRRGKFFTTPKEEYLKRRAIIREEEEKLREIQEQKLEEERAAAAEESRKRELEEAKRLAEEEEEAKKKEAKAQVHKADKAVGKSPKKEKSKEINKKDKERKKSGKSSKKSKGSKSDGDEAKSESTGTTITDGPKSKPLEDIVKENVQDTIEMVIEDGDTESYGEGGAEENSAAISRNREPSFGRDPGKYPENIPDVKGFYGPEPKEINTTDPYQHDTRSVVIVRTIVEIPLMDDKMQQTLMAASQSYEKIVQEQNKVFEPYNVDDPRKEEEKEMERQIKREIVEENLQQMQLLEQSAGKLLELVI